MGEILNFNNWKRLNEQATQNPVALNNEISALRPGDQAGMWAICKRYGGLENVLDILFDSGASKEGREKIADRIRSKFGKDHFGIGGDGSMPKVSALLDEFEEATTLEIWKDRFIPNDDTYTGGEGQG
jgi:hypothetical protein